MHTKLIYSHFFTYGSLVVVSYNYIALQNGNQPEHTEEILNRESLELSLVFIHRKNVHIAYNWTNMSSYKMVDIIVILYLAICTDRLIIYIKDMYVPYPANN